MRKISCFLKIVSIPFLVIAMTLLSSFSVRSGICEEIRDNKALDEQVLKFLDSRKGAWHDLNVPYADGKVLYDLVLKNNYKKAF